MLDNFTSDQLQSLLEHNLSVETWDWYKQKLTSILENSSDRELYVAYSLCASKIDRASISYTGATEVNLKEYLEVQNADLLELSRINLLVKVLEGNASFFKDKVGKLMEIADSKELETFLKYLVFLPNASDYQYNAVEALRTNISTVFDAITLNNPYPSMYFNEQQWNQMYLKAAFMERDLGCILDVDKRANKELARIISDYAHERWAASRAIDPEIWRPVSSFLGDGLMEDMNHLFQSKNPLEQRAAALCCYNSNYELAAQALNKHPELKSQIESSRLTWDNFKN